MCWIFHWDELLDSNLIKTHSDVWMSVCQKKYSHWCDSSDSFQNRLHNEDSDKSNLPTAECRIVHNSYSKNLAYITAKRRINLNERHKVNRTLVYHSNENSSYFDRNRIRVILVYGDLIEKHNIIMFWYEMEVGDEIPPTPVNVYKHGYNGIGYSQINLFLRHVKDFALFIPETPRMRFIYDTIQGIDRSMEVNEEPIMAYRGVSLDFYLSLPSNEIINKGYTSTTTSLEVALGYANDGVLLRFVIPPGMGIYRYKHDYEKEILVQRNTKFTRLRERGVKNGILYVDCTLEPL